MKSVVKILMNTVVPIAILVGAALAGRALVASREGPPRAPQDRRAALVEVVEAESVFERVMIDAQGAVVPAREVSLQPQVSGRAQEVNENLVPGGLVDEGDLLVRVDARDYALAIQQLEASLEQARATLQLERGRQEVAEREWALFRDMLPSDDEDDALATRQPQVRSAEVAVESIETQIRQAQLNLSRTRLEAPFDALVRSETVEIGQIVGPNAPVATLVDRTRYWVEVAVPYDQLASIAIPGVNATEGSRAEVRVVMGEREATREGRVLRLAGELDRTGRMAVVIVEVLDPLDLESGETNRVPLLLGAFVDVRIEASTSLRAIEVPRLALREGDFVYVVTDDNTLAIRPVEIAWGHEDRVLVSSGVAAGEPVVVSRLSGAADGMDVRIAGEAEGSGAAPAPAPDEPADAEAP